MTEQFGIASSLEQMRRARDLLCKHHERRMEELRSETEKESARQLRALAKVLDDE